MNTSPFPLTRREREVLVQMTRGLTNVEIGRELFIAPQTVKFHTKRIFDRLDARNRTHAVVLGIALGLVDVEVAL